MPKSKKYAFRESDPAIKETLDELARNRQFTPTIHKLLVDGLGKEIKKAQNQLKQRLAKMSKAATKLEKRYEMEEKK